MFIHPVGLYLFYYSSYFAFVWYNSLILIRPHSCCHFLYTRNDYKIYYVKRQEYEANFQLLQKGFLGLEIYNKTSN